MFRAILKIVLALLLIAGAWVVWALLLPTRPSQTKFVLLRPGWSSEHIAKELQSQGVIHSWRAFLLYHYVVRPGSLKAGEYKFDERSSALQVHGRLTRGDIYIHEVVVPEGYNMFDIAQTVEGSGLGSAADFLKAAQQQVTLIKDLDPNAVSLEGYLFPDTYGFTRTQTMTDIVGAMVRRFHQEAKALGLNGDVHRVVTLASIVEKETAAPDERPAVAGVYQNRLDRHMALDADPSVIYASLLAGHYDGVIHQSDLQYDSRYNTYKYPGLPPGPIANPGKASLEAAMHPQENDYFYFVADGSGTGHHRFARTLDEHSRNVAAYRRLVAHR